MASTTKLKLTFLNGEGSNVNFTYNYADAEVSASDVNALMAGMITNGSIFANSPVTKKSASIIVTTETAIAING